jgi:hypothetical protein
MNRAREEVLGGFWKSDSLPDGEIPAGPAPAVEPTLFLWRDKQWPISYLQATIPEHVSWSS